MTKVYVLIEGGDDELVVSAELDLYRLRSLQNLCHVHSLNEVVVSLPKYEARTVASFEGAVPTDGFVPEDLREIITDELHEAYVSDTEIKSATALEALHVGRNGMVHFEITTYREPDQWWGSFDLKDVK